MRSIVAQVVLASFLLNQAFAQGAQNTGPGPVKPPDGLFDHLKKENVDKMPKVTVPRNPEELESDRKTREIEEKTRLLREYRRTGVTRLSPAELENLLAERGIPKDHPKFVSYPPCTSTTDLSKDVCGVPDGWTVLLKASVRYDQVDSTVEMLFAKYHAKHRPVLGAQILDGKPVKDSYILDGLAGALLLVEMSEVMARQMSEEPTVRYVAQLQRGGRVRVNGGYGHEFNVPANKPVKKPVNKSATKPATAFDFTAYKNLDRANQFFLPHDNSYTYPNFGSGADVYSHGTPVLLSQALIIVSATGQKNVGQKNKRRQPLECGCLEPLW